MVRRAPLWLLLAAPLALAGCEDDCQKFVHKSMTVLELYSHKESTREQAVAAVDQCHAELAKDPNNLMVKCVVAADTDDDVMTCMKAGRDGKLKPRAAGPPPVPVSPAAPAAPAAKP